VHSKWSWDEFLSCGDESIVYRVIKNLVRSVEKKEEKMFRKMYWYCGTVVNVLKTFFLVSLKQYQYFSNR
jgi:hypothetical protein